MRISVFGLRETGSICAASYRSRLRLPKQSARSINASTTLALCEPIPFAVYFEHVDVTGEAIQQGASEPLGAKDGGLLVGQITDDDG